MAEKNKKIVDLRSGDPDSPSPPSSEHTEPMEGVSQGETSESEPSHVESSSEGHALHQHVALPGPHILENWGDSQMEDPLSMVDWPPRDVEMSGRMGNSVRQLQPSASLGHQQLDSSAPASGTPALVGERGNIVPMPGPSGVQGERGNIVPLAEPPAFSNESEDSLTLSGDTSSSGERMDYVSYKVPRVPHTTSTESNAEGRGEDKDDHEVPSGVQPHDTAPSSHLVPQGSRSSVNDSRYSEGSVGPAQVPNLIEPGAVVLVDSPVGEPLSIEYRREVGDLPLQTARQRAQEEGLSSDEPSLGNKLKRATIVKRARKDIEDYQGDSSYPASTSFASSTQSSTQASGSSGSNSLSLGNKSFDSTSTSRSSGSSGPSSHGTRNSYSSHVSNASGGTQGSGSQSVSSVGSHDRTVGSSASGLGDISSDSSEHLSHTQDGDVYFKPPTAPSQTLPVLCEEEQLDPRICRPHSATKKTSDESTTSSSSCGPPVKKTCVVGITDSEAILQDSSTKARKQDSFLAQESLSLSSSGPGVMEDHVSHDVAEETMMGDREEGEREEQNDAGHVPSWIAQHQHQQCPSHSQDLETSTCSLTSDVLRERKRTSSDLSQDSTSLSPPTKTPHREDSIPVPKWITSKPEHKDQSTAMQQLGTGLSVTVEGEGDRLAVGEQVTTDHSGTGEQLTTSVGSAHEASPEVLVPETPPSFSDRMDVSSTVVPDTLCLLSPKVESSADEVPITQSSQDQTSVVASTQDQDQTSVVASTQDQDQTSGVVSSQDQASAVMSSQDHMTTVVSSQDQTSDVVSSQDQTTTAVSSQDQTSAVVSSQDQTSAVVSSQDQTSAVVSSQDQTSAVVSSQDQIPVQSEPSVIDVFTQDETSLPDEPFVIDVSTPDQTLQQDNTTVFVSTPDQQPSSQQDGTTVFVSTPDQQPSSQQDGTTVLMSTPDQQPSSQQEALSSEVSPGEEVLSSFIEIREESKEEEDLMEDTESTLPYSAPILPMNLHLSQLTTSQTSTQCELTNMGRESGYTQELSVIVLDTTVERSNTTVQQGGKMAKRGNITSEQVDTMAEQGDEITEQGDEGSKVTSSESTTSSKHSFSEMSIGSSSSSSGSEMRPPLLPRSGLMTDTVSDKTARQSSDMTDEQSSNEVSRQSGSVSSRPINQTSSSLEEEVPMEDQLVATGNSDTAQVLVLGKSVLQHATEEVVKSSGEVPIGATEYVLDRPLEGRHHFQREEHHKGELTLEDLRNQDGHGSHKVPSNHGSHMALQSSSPPVSCGSVCLGDQSQERAVRKHRMEDSCDGGQVSPRLDKPKEFVVAKETEICDDIPDPNSQFNLPVVSIGNESQSQLQDSFLFKSTFQIDRPQVKAVVVSDASKAEYSPLLRPVCTTASPSSVGPAITTPTLTGSTLAGSNLIVPTITGSTLAGSNLIVPTITGSTLAGSNFTVPTITGSTLAGSIITKPIIPISTTITGHPITEPIVTLLTPKPSPQNDPYEFSSPDKPAVGVVPVPPTTTQGKCYTVSTIVTKQVTQIQQEIVTEFVQDGVVVDKKQEERLDEPKVVLLHRETRTSENLLQSASFTCQSPDIRSSGSSLHCPSPTTLPSPLPMSDVSISSPPASSVDTHAGQLQLTPRQSLTRVTTATFTQRSRPSHRQKTEKGKRKAKRSPCVTPPTVNEEENPLHPSDSCSSILSSSASGSTVKEVIEGARVFAKWKTDFFPAVVLSVADKEIEVKYDDEEDPVCLPHKDVIPLYHPLPPGVEVLVVKPDSKYTKAVIHACHGDSIEGPYQVSYSQAKGNFKNKFVLGELVLANKMKNRKLLQDSFSGKFAHLSSDTRKPSMKKTPARTAALMAKKMKTQVSRGFFDGKYFVLTVSKDQEASSEKCYNREEMTEQITSNGGTVVESPLHCEASYDDIFCISDGPCRKLKFLSSLAVGIACLSYLFVNDCVKKHKMVDYEKYLLPVGVSSKTGEFITRNPIKPGTIFKDMNILLSGDDSFKTQWEEIVRAAGGCLLSRLSLTSQGSAANTVVVCSSTHQKYPGDAVVRRAIGLGISVVSVDWICESLMQGKPATFT